MKNLSLLMLIFSSMGAAEPPLVSYTAATLDLHADQVETDTIRAALRVAADRVRLNELQHPYNVWSLELLYDLTYDRRLRKNDPVELADALAKRIPVANQATVHMLYYHLNNPEVVKNPPPGWIKAVQRLADNRNIKL